MFEAVCQSPHLSSLCVYKGGDFIACFGVNDGDGMGVADDVVLDDVYRLRSEAEMLELELCNAVDRGVRLAPDGKAGTPGNRLNVDCTLTLMAPNARTIDLVVVAECDANRRVLETYLLPIQKIDPSLEYRLILRNRNPDPNLFDAAIRRPLARGTRITCASGRQCAIEDLRPGDKVLTRDAGPQTIRRISQRTQRASNDEAPVMIEAGVIGNAGPLCLNPDQQILFVPGAGQLSGGVAERYVAARALENGTTVVQKPGGFMDFFQLHFDRSHVIFAEGIAIEAPKTALPVAYAALLAGVSVGPARADPLPILSEA
ncbi:MAG: Hint domain-containing protein [Pseudomonadota bacterium]